MSSVVDWVQSLLQSIQDWVTRTAAPSVFWLMARVSLQTYVYALCAAGGMFLLLMGLRSRLDADLDRQVAATRNIYVPGLLERLQMTLDQSGLRIQVTEFLMVGMAIGFGLGGVLFMLGFVALGLIGVGCGPFLYYQFLLRRRLKALQQFREELPTSIELVRDLLAINKNDLLNAMLKMSTNGPQSTRQYYDQAYRWLTANEPAEAVFRRLGRLRPEPFYRQMCDALANRAQSGNTGQVLTRIARGQKTHNRLQAKTRAKQSGLRLVGTLYLVAPVAFVVFISLAGGHSIQAFYATPLGQVIQLGAVLAGGLSYWMSGRIAARGLYLDDLRKHHIINTADIPPFVGEGAGLAGAAPVVADAALWDEVTHPGTGFKTAADWLDDPSDHSVSTDAAVAEHADDLPEDEPVLIDEADELDAELPALAEWDTLTRNVFVQPSGPQAVSDEAWLDAPAELTLEADTSVSTTATWEGRSGEAANDGVNPAVDLDIAQAAALASAPELDLALPSAPEPTPDVADEDEDQGTQPLPAVSDLVVPQADAPAHETAPAADESAQSPDQAQRAVRRVFGRGPSARAPRKEAE